MASISRSRIAYDTGRECTAVLSMPYRSEAADHEPVELRPGQPVEPTRDVRLDPLGVCAQRRVTRADNF
jgi:hypothetical protein